MKYSASTMGFYNEETHGTPTINIPDPSWVRPTIQVSQDDGAGGTIMVDVPDESAVHPAITVPNPDCKIPVDAVDVSPAAYAALMEAQAAGATIQPDALGNPVAVVPVVTAAEVWQMIKSKRDTVRAAGVLVGAKWYHTDDTSRIQQLGLKDEARDMLAAGAAATDQLVIDGAPVVWKTLDGTFVAMTVQLALDIVAAVKVLDKRAFAAAETHRAAMEAAADPAGYDYSAGWPAGFAG